MSLPCSPQKVAVGGGGGVGGGRWEGGGWEAGPVDYKGSQSSPWPAVVCCRGPGSGLFAVDSGLHGSGLRGDVRFGFSNLIIRAFRVGSHVLMRPI